MDNGTAWLSKQEYGQVPQYLLKRKLAMAAAYAQELVRMLHACSVRAGEEVVWRMAGMVKVDDGRHQHSVGRTQAEKEASLIPQGMRILPEEERLDMLAMLAKSRAEATEKLLARLPISALSVYFTPRM